MKTKEDITTLLAANTCWVSRHLTFCFALEPLILLLVSNDVVKSAELHAHPEEATYAGLLCVDLRLCEAYFHLSVFSGYERAQRAEVCTLPVPPIILETALLWAKAERKLSMPRPLQRKVKITLTGIE